MYEDPIVAETRRLRDEFAGRFDYDLNAICRYLHEQQRTGGRRVVKRSPKRPDLSCFLAAATELADAEPTE